MKKTIRDFDLNNKKVIIRVDFNVPIKNQMITDDTRIKESLDTINYAINNNAKVILMSHLGRIKTKEDEIKNDLQIVSERLSKLLNKEIIFINATRGIELEKAINDLKCGDVLLMQNTRYEDLIDQKESSNDLRLGKYWASLGDIYINDAFGTSHRAHASNVGIATYLPSGIGFLIEKELKYLQPIINNPKRPFVVILGGSKVSDKIGVIKNLVNKADYILIGGGMAYTFLKASQINIGKSLVDEENIDFCKYVLENYADKIILPIDTVNVEKIEDSAATRQCFINEIKENEIGIDIGYNTLKLFKTYLEQSKTVIWNGPVGIFEIDSFSKGTRGLCEILKNISAVKIIGGGDTASAVINLGYKDCFDHISTGGGASLELLEGKKLPGIEVIEENEN
ncbi:MAG: phosphoglycerate kinase [Bacilli bacterium]|nr:phosphoglycerate kinase [Bacilli bacterium]